VQKAGLSMELSAKAMTAEMYRGNLEMAERYMKDYIASATYDIQQQKEEVMWFMDYYSNEYNALDTKLQNSIQQTLGFIQHQEAIQREELTNKMNIVMRAAEAGINLNLSGKEIASMDMVDMVGLYTQKVSQMPVVPEQPKVFGGETGGYTEQFYNPETNQWEYRQVKGGMGWKPESLTVSKPTQTQLEKWGLPPLVASQPWETTLGQLMETTPSNWFGAYLEGIEERDANTQGRKARTISPQEQQARWDEYRSEVLWGFKDDDEKTGDCFLDKDGKKICY
jgi:hypothetical protein